MGRQPATNSIVLRYGLHLFRRDTTIWQVYIKLDGEKPVRKSLKTDDLNEAKELAWKAYTEATARQIKGQPLRRVTFKRRLASGLSRIAIPHSLRAISRQLCTVASSRFTEDGETCLNR